MSLSAKEAFQNRAEYKANLPGFEEIHAELIRLTENNPKLWQYQRGGQEIATWGYLLETICSSIWDKETTVNLELIDKVWHEYQERYRTELEQGAALWLYYLSKHAYDADYANIWQNTEKRFPLLWNCMLQNPGALLSMNKGIGTPARSRFEEQFICLWHEDDDIMKEWISKFFYVERMFDESLGMNLRDLFCLLEKQPNTKQVLADKVFECIAHSAVWEWERMGMDLREKQKRIQKRIKEALTALSDFGINPVTLLLEKWYDCNNISFINKLLQIQTMDKRITMKELVEHARVGVPEQIPDWKTGYCATFYRSLMEQMQIENQDTEAAKWFLDSLVQVLDEEELLFVKEKELFRFEEIAHSTQTALEKGYLEKLPFLLQWREDERWQSKEG